MRLVAEYDQPNHGVEVLTLDWESLGRLVRKRTLEAVALQFAAMAEMSEKGIPPCESTRTDVSE